MRVLLLISLLVIQSTALTNIQKDQRKADQAFLLIKAQLGQEAADKLGTKWGDKRAKQYKVQIADLKQQLKDLGYKYPTKKIKGKIGRIKVKFRFITTVCKGVRLVSPIGWATLFYEINKAEGGRCIQWDFRKPQSGIVTRGKKCTLWQD